MTKQPPPLPPNPDDLHYAAVVNVGVNDTLKAAKFWLHEANKSLLYELSEEIYSGDYAPGSNKWRSKVHLRALELMERDEDMRPAYRTKILQTIEDEALYHYAGYESSEEWFASEASLRKPGGLKSNYGWWARELIPWCKTNNVFADEKEADAFFFSPLNTDGSSRVAMLREATPDLRDVIDRDIYELEQGQQVVVVKNLLDNVSDSSKSVQEKKQYINDVREYLNSERESKMEINVYKNGDGRWHITDTHLTDHQLERLQTDLRWSAHIIFLDGAKQETKPVIDW